MSCKTPLIRIEYHNRPYKTADGHLAYKATVERADDVLNRLEEIRNYPNTKAQIIPCGQCIGCRLDYSREWANRTYLESKLYKQNWFVTLTYDDEHLKTKEITEAENEKGELITYTNDGNWNGTLNGKDLQKFMHDLRQIMNREYHQQGIRFIGCGEYGDKGERPHYHLILLNCNLPAETFYKPRIINNEYYYQNQIIEKAWKKGISNISEATWNNIAYTARYITKKINGKLSQEHYARRGQDREFLRTSRKPGIGKPYYDLYKDKIYKNDSITIKNKEGIITCKPPKYFDGLYEKENPKEFKKIQRKREKERREADKIKDENTSLTRLQQLLVEKRTKENQTKALVRNMEQKRKQKIIG